MKKHFLKFMLKSSLPLLISIPLFSQNNSITLTFSGDNNGTVVDLESVWIKNLTQNCDTTLYSPSLLLVIDTLTTGIATRNFEAETFFVSQNYPNPFAGQTSFEVCIPEKSPVDFVIYNLIGQRKFSFSHVQNKGTATYRFVSGSENIYLVMVYYKDQKQAIRMISSRNEQNSVCGLTCISEKDDSKFKSVSVKSGFDFNPGDQLLLVGYANDEESGLLDSPSNNTDYLFQFATNIPCPGVDSLYYDGQWYHTIQIYSQCWMKENLNAGTMINSASPQTNNNIIEKYCMSDLQYGCEVFGGIYFWDEMMQYTEESGGQGICPTGWHVPTDQEWQILEGSVDSQYGIGDNTWFYGGWRGTDAGGNLKQAGNTWWQPPNTGATDAFGFCALPAGYFVQNTFWGPEYKTYIWSSSYPTHYFRNMDFDKAFIARGSAGSDAAISVRCLKNELFKDQVAYWNFENNANDQVGNYNPSLDGIVDLTYEDSYKPGAGQCAFFNGTTTIVEIPDGDQLINTSDFTLSFWVKANSIGHVGENGEPKGHFVMGLAAFFGFQFEISADYSWCKLAASYELADGTTASEDLWFAGDGLTGSNGGWQGWTFCKDLTNLGGVQALLMDTWAHVVCTYNSQTKEGIMYINGEIMKAQDFDLWPDGDPKQGVVGLKYGGVEPLVYPMLAFGFIQSREGTLWANEPWGNYFLPTSNHFGGWLDNVRIYHIALTEGEVMILHDQEKP